MEKNKKNILRYYIIGSAVIWTVTILGCALILGETFTQVSLLLTGAAAIHLIIWGALAAQLKKTERGVELKQR